MKSLRLLPALLCFCALAASGQTFIDDLATKRNNLVYRMRALGPLAPSVWSSSGAAWVINGEANFGSNNYHSVGRYAYIGNNGNEWFYQYAGLGINYPNISFFVNPAVQFGHFGLHDYEPAPYYTWVMDAQSYNAAGLRYLGLGLFADVSSTGFWILQPGTNFTPPANTYPFSANRQFELLQIVETPSFRVADYWFGHWPNYPEDVTLPQPQKSQSQNAGAFLVTPINTWFTNRLWVKEGVYRPGFALQPGHTTPRLYTFMEQYANNLYQTDATTGDVPRTTTQNWNGRGRINTATARTTGRVDNSYYIRTSEPGKAILTTRPLEDGSYGELPIYTLAMFVDKNRDGTLNTNDVTSSTSPHVFWVNNDYDRAIYEEKNLWDELDLVPQATSYTNDAQFVHAHGIIPTLRDLEDYDRLHIRGLRELSRDLPVGTEYQAVLRWKTIQSGNPGIYVLNAVGSDGSAAYLTNAAVAATQITPNTYPPSIGSVPGTYMGLGLNLLAVGAVQGTVGLNIGRQTNDFFIYCGTSRGAGELAVTIYRGSQIIGETSVFLDLRDVKELYERWTLGEPGTLGAMPTTNATLFGGGLPSGVPTTAFTGDNSNRHYILYVHGWNMTPDDKDSFAETAYKRLYWQGYTNRFGALRWPTAYNFGDDLLTYPGPVFTPDHFNRSEYYAWNAGEGTRVLLTNLNQRYPGRVFVLGHSMGNVVVGEALSLNAQKYGGGQIVNTYVASQAAVSLHAYNGTNNDPSFQLPFQYIHPKIQSGGYGPSSWDSGTPNVHRNWLETNRVSCLARVNFYNLHDYALQMDCWGFNQLFKPSSYRGGSYRYVGAAKPWPLVGWLGGPRPSPTSAFMIPSLARLAPTSPAFRNLTGYFTFNDPGFEFRKLDWEYRLNDMYEVMAFGSESRIAPLGAVLDSTVLEGRVNLQAVWSNDSEPDPDNGTHGRHKWHSGQFRMNNMRQRDYWRALVDIRGFNILQ